MQRGPGQPAQTMQYGWTSGPEGSKGAMFPKDTSMHITSAHVTQLLEFQVDL